MSFASFRASWLLVLLASVALFFAVSHANANNVIDLKDDDFWERVQNGEPWFVEFYAPWCGFCKRLVPTWNEMATNLKGQVNVAKVDCTTEHAVKNAMGITGFPTLKVIRDGKLYDYKGPRDLESLQTFALRTDLTNGVPLPTSPSGVDTMLAFVERYGQDLVVLLNDNPILAAVIFGVGVLLGIFTGMLIAIPLLSGPVVYTTTTYEKQDQTTVTRSSHAGTATRRANLVNLDSSSEDEDELDKSVVEETEHPEPKKVR